MLRRKSFEAVCYKSSIKRTRKYSMKVCAGKSMLEEENRCNMLTEGSTVQIGSGESSMESEVENNG